MLGGRKLGIAISVLNNATIYGSNSAGLSAAEANYLRHSTATYAVTFTEYNGGLMVTYTPPQDPSPFIKTIFSKYQNFWS